MKRTILVLMITAVLFAGCGTVMRSAPLPSLGAPSMDIGFGGAPAEAPMIAEQGLASDAGAYEYERAATTSNTAEAERMVIKNADLAIVVTDTTAKIEAITAMTDEMEGFVVSSNIYQTISPKGNKVPEAYMTIRIPAEELDDALTQIKADVVEVQSEQVTGEDVTDAYVDLESRLRAKEAAAERLLTIMQQATETEDVLNVLGRLESIESEIEVIKGQMQYYEKSAKLSSINIHIIAEETTQTIEIGPWKPVGVALDAIQTLINFLKGFVNFLIWLLLFIAPVAALIGIPIWLIVHGIRRWRVKRQTKAPLAKK